MLSRPGSNCRFANHFCHDCFENFIDGGGFIKEVVVVKGEAQKVHKMLLVLLDKELAIPLTLIVDIHIDFPPFLVFDGAHVRILCIVFSRDRYLSVLPAFCPLDSPSTLLVSVVKELWNKAQSKRNSRLNCIFLFLIKLLHCFILAFVLIVESDEQQRQQEKEEKKRYLLRKLSFRPSVDELKTRKVSVFGSFLVKDLMTSPTPSPLGVKM